MISARNAKLEASTAKFDQAMEHIEKEIKEAIRHGEYGANTCCRSELENKVFHELRSNGYVVTPILRESHMTIFKVEWR